MSDFIQKNAPTKAYNAGDLSAANNISGVFLNSILLTLLFIFSLSVNAIAQTGVLSGTVKMNDGSPVAYAVVSVKNTQYQSLTDEKGHFEFKNIAFGKYELLISSIEITSKSVTIDFNGDKHRHTITVEPNAGFTTEEVLINAKSAQKQIETQGFAVNVINTELASMQSIQTNELLDRSASVRIRQDGGLGSRINYNINGMSGNAVKIFIDGIPSSNYGSSFSLNSIPPSLIERIEVYKGVVPAYLSDDALGGAINIILKKKIRNTFTTSYSGGSFNTHQWNANGSYRSKKGLTVGASAFFNYSDNSYKVWGKSISFKKYTGEVLPNQTARRFHDAYMSYGTKAEIGFTDVKWADRFMIGGVFSKDYKEIQHGITMDLVYGDRHTRRNSNVATLTYAKKDLFTKGLTAKVDASYSYIKRQAIDTVGIMYDWSGNPITFPDGEPVRYNSGAEVASQKTLGINSDKTLMTKANLSYTIKNNHTFYLNYLHNNFIRGITDELQHPALQALVNTRDVQKNIVAITYENIAFKNRLRTNIFYKHYFQKATSNEPYRKDIVQGIPNYEMTVIKKKVDYSGYGLTLAYEVISNLYILGSFEKAIRLPSPDEMFGNVNDNLLPPAGAGLNPETSYNGNIGVNWTGNFNKHMVKVNTSLFYRNTRGMIREAIRTGSFTYSQFENLENVLSRGIDAEIVYNFARKFNFTFNISKFDALFNTEFDANGAPYLFYRMQIRNEPSFKFNANAMYTIENLFAKKARASIYYNISYVKQFLRNWANIGGKNLDYIPTQFMNDIGVSYTIPSNKITVSVDAKNITNQQVFDNFGLQKPGRAFYAKIIFSLNSK